MLHEYKRYLLSLRNNFIRCGVGVGVSDVDGYEDVFYLGEKLSDLLWFYTVLGVSGSEDKLNDFIYPMNTFYMGKIKDKYYEDYLLYKAGYMQISASDAMYKESLKKLNNVENSPKLDKVIKVGVSYIDEDGFVVYADEGSREPDEVEDEFVNWGGSDSEEVEDSEEDEFVNWGSSDSTEDSEEDEDEDGFVNWGGSSEDSEDEEEDEFVNWGGSAESEIIEDDEDVFVNWGGSSDEVDGGESVDEEDEFINWGNTKEDYIEEDENSDDDFVNWGGSEEIDSEIVEDSEDEFSNWGNQDEEYVEEENEEDVDDFGSWGNSSEEYIEEEIVEDEDSFGNWGNSDDSEDYEETDEYEEDVFGSWGGDDTEEDFIDNQEDSLFGNWGSESENSISPAENINNNPSRVVVDSKIDREIRSNDRTAEAIEKIASGLFSKSNVLKSKVAEKIKNTDK